MTDLGTRNRNLATCTRVDVGGTSYHGSQRFQPFPTSEMRPMLVVSCINLSLHLSHQLELQAYYSQFPFPSHIFAPNYFPVHARSMMSSSNSTIPRW